MKRIAIIGAGPAGLSAAYELLLHSKDCQVVIFEKDSIVGGLSKTFDFEGGRVDVGGHRYFTKNEEVFKLWNDVLPYSDDGMLIRDRKSHILWESRLITYPIQLDLKTVKSLGLRLGIQVAISYIFAKMKKIEIQSLEDFYINRFGKKLYILFFRDYTHKLWGLPASMLSSDWGMQRIRKISLGQLLRSFIIPRDKDFEERSLITKYHYPAKGAGQLWEALSARIVMLGGDIRLNCSVEKINTHGSLLVSIQSINTLNCSKGNIEEFDYIISSMPLVDLIAAIDCTPSPIREIGSRLEYRDMVVVGIELDVSSMGSIFHEAHDDSWLYMQDSSVTFGRLQILNNWSPLSMNKKDHVVIELEYFCNHSDALWSCSDKELVDLSLGELKGICFCNDTAVPISSIVKRIEKAYPVYTDGYFYLQEVRTWLDGWDNLQCIGRNGQHRYNNMDHSVETGLIAARNIITGEKDKESLWSVNEKKEYHEQ